jgi:DNA repair protein RecO (recombination protein O)
MPMKIISDEAVVIGLMDYRETDRIVSLFSREHGRISGIARGARRSVKRFGGALELFARLSISFHPGEALLTLREVDLRTIYPQIRATLAGIAHAGYAAELVAALSPERHANQRVFRLLTAYLEHLDQAPATPADRHFFEVNLLNILGYRPPLEHCAGCGADLGPGGGLWSSASGHGIYCQRCASAGTRLSAATVALLRQSLATGRFGQIGFSSEALAETDEFLHDFIAAHIQRPLKSLAFLRLSP